MRIKEVTTSRNYSHYFYSSCYLEFWLLSLGFSAHSVIVHIFNSLVWLYLQIRKTTKSWNSWNFRYKVVRFIFYWTLEKTQCVCHLYKVRANVSHLVNSDNSLQIFPSIGWHALSSFVLIPRSGPWNMYSFLQMLYLNFGIVVKVNVSSLDLKLFVWNPSG